MSSGLIRHVPWAVRQPLYLCNRRYTDSFWLVLYKCLEAILRASLDHNSLSIEKFARWSRAICTISLARNTPADKVKAIGYVEQALSVIEEHSDNNEVWSYSHPKLSMIVCLLINNRTLLRTSIALPHGRTAMATSNSVQHWNRVSTVRSLC